MSNKRIVNALVESKIENLNEPNEFKASLVKFQKSKCWYTDSVCSIYVTRKKDSITNMRKINNKNLTIAGGELHGM